MRKSARIWLLAMYATCYTVVFAQPTIDGVFDGLPTWGSAVASADGLSGWAGADINDLYVTSDATYAYIAVIYNVAADWQSWGIAINTTDNIGYEWQPSTSW